VTGRIVSFETEVRLPVGATANSTASSKAEFDEALNDALLVANEMCNTERYGKEVA
jgi:hypothetical protein